MANNTKNLLLAEGVLQRVERIASAETVLIIDQIHGTHHISEPILVALIQSQALLRLSKIHQHGVTGLLGVTPPVTRYEHSVGAMLIVRGAGGSLEEQVFGLLHDIAHTVLSHVVDWALSSPGTSYHEEHMLRYVETTELPKILADHGYKYPDCLEESNFPLVEHPSPHLCADRLDYALRDAVSFGKLSSSDAVKVVKNLIVTPSIDSARRLITLRDPAIAHILAQAYLAMDKDVWSNPVHIEIYRKTGEIIRNVSQIPDFQDHCLWEMSDPEFWEYLRIHTTEENRHTMKQLETKKLHEYDVQTLPVITKIRTIDPDVCEVPGGEPIPLSALNAAYAHERQQYILSRDTIMKA